MVRARERVATWLELFAPSAPAKMLVMRAVSSAGVVGLLSPASGADTTTAPTGTLPSARPSSQASSESALVRPFGQASLGAGAGAGVFVAGGGAGAAGPFGTAGAGFGFGAAGCARTSRAMPSTTAVRATK